MERKMGVYQIFTFAVLILLLGAFLTIPADIVAAAQAGEFIYTTGGNPTVATITKFYGKGEVSIPPTLGGYSTVAIGSGAFKSNSMITSIELPSSIKFIGNYAFQSCSSLQSIDLGRGVTSIGRGAFLSCNSLLTIMVPGNVVSIGDDAFSDCTSLFSATLLPGVKSIGGWAFNRCTSLTQIQMMNGVTSIGDYAFYSCTSLQSVSIPSGIVSIGEGAFESCTSLQQIDTNSNNRYYTSLDGVLYNKVVTELVQYPGGRSGAFSIPNSVSTIGIAAFSECRLLDEINIPSSVTTIKEGAFFHCTSLPSITLPMSVTSIGDEAFKMCTSLTRMIFEGNAPTCGWEWVRSHNVALRAECFRGATGFTLPIWQDIDIICLTTPSMPQGLGAACGNRQVTISWNAPTRDGGSTITGYQVYRSTTEEGVYSRLSVATNNSFEDSNLINAQAYWYRVSALNANGEGVQTYPLATMPSTVPGAPENLAAIPDMGGVSLKWQKPQTDGGSPITGYTVFRDSAGTSYPIAILGAISFSYYDRNVTVGTNYTYCIAASNSNGVGTDSAEVVAAPLSAKVVDNTVFYIGAGAVAIVIAAIALIMIRKKR